MLPTIIIIIIIIIGLLFLNGKHSDTEQNMLFVT